MAVICVAELTMKKLAGTVPKFTAVVPLKFVPVSTTWVPPDVETKVDAIPVTVGAEPRVYVNWSLEEVADVPLTVVTRTSTVPTDSAGAVVVIDVAELTVKLLAGVEPNEMLATKDLLLASMKLVPLIVTEVPPAVVPVVVPR